MDMYKKGNKVRLTLATATKAKGSIGTIIGRRNEMVLKVLFAGDEKPQFVPQIKAEPYKTFIVGEPVLLLEARGGYQQGAVLHVATIDLEDQTANVMFRGKFVMGIPVNVPLSILKKWKENEDG